MLSKEKRRDMSLTYDNDRVLKKVVLRMPKSASSFFYFALESNENILQQKIQSFIDLDVYEENRDFIKIIFSPESDFFINERIDVVKVLSTLKDNGLIKLFFTKPQELKLHFKTSGSPLFFVKPLTWNLNEQEFH